VIALLVLARLVCSLVVAMKQILGELRQLPVPNSDRELTINGGTTST
jgi:hypothetical protein